MTTPDLNTQLAALDLSIRFGRMAARVAPSENEHNAAYFRGWVAALETHREWLLGASRESQHNIVEINGGMA